MRILSGFQVITVFTQMQDDSNLKRHSAPPPQKKLPKRKSIYLYLNDHPKNKMSAKKKYFTTNFIHLQSMSHSIYLYQSLSLSPSPVSVFPTPTPNIPIVTAIPQHITNSPIHCIRYTALLKTLHNHFWHDELL
jgi:hypothetical protein